MWIIRGILISVLFGSSWLVVKSQINDWQKFQALVSTRTEVEKILGEPETKFESFGVYKKEAGKFHVWYSMGGCRKGVEGFQYDVPAGRLTSLGVYVNDPLPVKDYFLAHPKYHKSRSLTRQEHTFDYRSEDGTLVVQTLLRNDGTEVVYTITIKPSKEQEERCLCKSER